VLFSIEKATIFNPEHAHHVMVVTETGTVTQEQLNSWKNKPGYNGNFKIGDKYARIVQGNNGDTSVFKRGEEDPTDEDYSGQKPQTATYNLSTDTFVRDYRPKEPVTKKFSDSESGNQAIGKLTGSNN
jgi:hypothetical protein